MSLVINDQGGITHVPDRAHTGTDQRCDLLEAVRMLVDTHADLCAAVRRQYGNAPLPPDLQVRIDFGSYMLKRMRGGELANLARICNASR